MKYIVKLKKRDNTVVTAIVEARTEREAGRKASKTANAMAKNNSSRVLKTDAPLKPISSEVWDTDSSRVMEGDKVFGVLVVKNKDYIEDVVQGVAGEKSAYNLVMKQLKVAGEVRVFIFDLNQKPVQVYKPLKELKLDDKGNLTTTIKEAIREKRISFKEFYEVIMDNFSGTDDINSTEIIEQYIEEKEADGIEVSHIREALEAGCDTDVWKIWLGNSMETPEPIETKQDLAEYYLELGKEELGKELVFNIHNR